MSQTSVPDVAREGLPAPVQFTRAEVLAKIRTAFDARVIAGDYAQTLIELVELLSDGEPQARPAGLPLKQQRR